jgi:alpha,alpha-trehalase
MTKLDINREDLARWDTISCNMYVPFIRDGKVIEQFEGFDKLKDLDWDRYREQYGDILRLDRILEKEEDSVDNYKAVKQADVLMLFYLFSAEELKELFGHMSYDFDPAYIPLNISYYQSVTSHGSTLSKLVYSWVLARSHREKSWHDFNKALISDFEDIQGGTTSEGIHLGAMAGTVDLVQRCYTGLEFRDEELHFNPKLPEKINRITFRLRYRNHDLEIDLTKKNLRLKSRGGWDHTVVVVRERRYTLKKGQERNFRYTSKKRKTRKKHGVNTA